MWTEKTLNSSAFELGGSGPTKLNILVVSKKAETTVDSTYLRVRVNAVDNENCTNLLSGDKIIDSQFCAGNTLSLIPGTCELKHGGSIERETWHFDKYFPYIYGINSHGKDCGYGKPAVFTKISEFVPWIESVVFDELGNGGSNGQGSDFVFVHDDLEVGDVCRTQNSDGVCTKQENCPKLVELYKKKKLNINFCSMAKGVSFCCPNDFIVRETTEDYTVGVRVGDDTEIDTCEKLFTEFRKKPETGKSGYYPPPSEGRVVLPEEIPHSVGIGWTLSDGKIDWKCAGALISQGYVLTSGSCLKANA